MYSSIVVPNLWQVQKARSGSTQISGLDWLQLNSFRWGIPAFLHATRLPALTKENGYYSSRLVGLGIKGRNLVEDDGHVRAHDVCIEMRRAI